VIKLEVERGGCCDNDGEKLWWLKEVISLLRERYRASRDFLNE
jgi:hypothetical protein